MGNNCAKKFKFTRNLKSMRCFVVHFWPAEANPFELPIFRQCTDACTNCIGQCSEFCEHTESSMSRKSRAQPNIHRDDATRVEKARRRQNCLSISHNKAAFYRATACNATHGIAVAILSVRLSVCQTRVL